MPVIYNHILALVLSVGRTAVCYVNRLGIPLAGELHVSCPAYDVS